MHAPREAHGGGTAPAPAASGSRGRERAAPPSLHDLQREFAGALRAAPNDAAAWIEDDGLDAAARLRVYSNNAIAVFEHALSLTFPVVARRVGTAFFATLCAGYRAAHPSRAGDLHEVGRAFAAFLRLRLLGTPYAWLAELAALEWAVADAAVAADADAVDATALAAVPAESLADTRLPLAPSLRTLAATVPVLSVWRANQSDGDGAAVDLDAGDEHVIVHRNRDGVVELRAASRAEVAFVAELARGACLGAALERSELPIEALPAALGALFATGAIAGVHVDPPRSP